MREGDRLTLDTGRLEALENEALEHWCDDPGIESAITQIEAGFADRVLAAETSPQLHVAAATELDAGARARRPWGRMTAGLLAGSLAAVFAWNTIEEAPEPIDALAQTSEAGSFQEASVAEPDALGRPSFRAEGTPGIPIPGDLDERIATYVTDYGADWGPAFRFHGTIAVSRGDEVVYARGFGEADSDGNRPNGTDTRYRLGLLTEQFTAAAVLQLRDQGKLGLKQNVSAFFPNYPRGAEITVGQLLAHTSGIPNYTALPDFHTWKDQAHTTDQLLARFSGLPLEFKPGTDFSPSNAGYFLLGAVVEKVSGQSYGDYVEEHVFAPAGMTRSSFGDAYETGEQAEGHVWNDEELLDPPDPIHMSVFGGAGGLVSSATDLVRWNAALHGGDVIAETSLAEMTTAKGSGYGYGLSVSEGYGQTVLSFPAAIDGFNGSMVYFVEDQTSVIVLCNTEVVPAARVAQDVSMMVFGDQPARRREAHEVKIAPSTYPRYEGTYSLTEDTWSRYAALTDPERFAMLQQVHVRSYGDRLYFDVPGHGLTWMHPMGGGRFFFKDHSGNRVTFDLDERKSARGMTLRSKNASFVFRRR